MSDPDVKMMARLLGYAARPGEVLTPAVESAVQLLEMGHAQAAKDLLKRALRNARPELAEKEVAK